MKRTAKTDGVSIPYTLIQSVHNDVQLQALPGGELRVYAPVSMRLKAVDAFVLHHAPQLRAAQRAQDAPAERQDGRRRIRFEGVWRAFSTAQGALHLDVTEDEVHLTLAHPDDENAVREALRQCLTELAQQRIPERIAAYHAVIGGTYRSVTVGDLGIKWGSCNREHDLSFSYKLLMAPPQCLDYVVIHELCHLHEFSHSARFWRMVRSHMQDFETWKKWLAAHRQELEL